MHNDSAVWSGVKYSKIVTFKGFQMAMGYKVIPVCYTRLGTKDFLTLCHAAFTTVLLARPCDYVLRKLRLREVRKSTLVKSAEV